MIAIYGKVPAKEIKKGGKDAIKQIEKWFKANPKKKVCHAQVWYGKMKNVRRGYVSEDINEAMIEALK